MRKCKLIWVLHISVGVSILLYQLHNRPYVTIANRDVIRELGESILMSLPENALIFSYTDINWNTIRYLQVMHCIRANVAKLWLTAFI